MDFSNVRGIVEGFYGRPYDASSRCAMLEALSGIPGSASWLHAPKDDPWHRLKWREARPEESRNSLQRCIRTASSLGICWIEGISPWRFEDGETSLLRARAEEAAGEGASAVAILFDDIPEPPCRALAGRQVAFAVDALDGRGLPVITCPSVYCDEQASTGGPQEYLREFQELLPDGWGMFWTGPAVVSREMGLGRSVERMAKKGSLLIWDNLLADDYTLRRIYLGTPSGDRVIEGCGYMLNPSSGFIPAMHSIWKLKETLGSPSDPPGAISGIVDGLSLLSEFHYDPWTVRPLVRELIDGLGDTLSKGGCFPCQAAKALERLKSLREGLVSSAGGFEILPHLNDVIKFLSIWRRALESSSSEEEFSRLMLDRLPWDHPLAIASAWKVCR